MGFFTFASTVTLGVLAALSCAAAQSFEDAQKIDVNTTGKLSLDFVVITMHLINVAFCT